MGARKMRKEPNPRELRTLKRQLRRRRRRERLGSVIGFKGKTIWDLLQLLIVPALLAGLALWFNNQASIREQERSILQRENEQKIAEDRSREEALQSYLDGFEGLLLQYDLRTSESDDEVRSVARARTLTVVRGLDGVRKGALVQFLYESRLIDKDNAVINLKGARLFEADLSWADLSGADLSEVSLYEADLSEVNLSEATLSGAFLAEADLSGADLSGADLSGANLILATLSEAELILADLSGANLSRANLSRADLSGADLSGADLSGADLSGAALSGATLSRADLRLADLSGANLSRADLSGADLSGVEYDYTTIWPGGFNPPEPD